MPVTGHDPLRPTRLDDFAGQPEVVRELSVILGAAKSRGEAPTHVLLSGPPGLGKTTLAGIIATESGLPLVSTSGPQLEKPGDLVSVLANLTRPTVVFVDEVHRIPKTVEETLYSAMEDGRIDIIIGEGRTARTLAMPLEPFVLVGATTRSGDLGGPFRDRFGHVAKLRPYDAETLATIITRSAGLLGLPLAGDTAAVIASRSRGTPRIANHLLRRVRDYAQMHQPDDGDQPAAVSAQVATEALELFGVDASGLTASDRELLTVLCRDFNGGPVGAETLATALGETASTISEVNEPYLMRQGLLARTPRGRIATAGAYRHLGLDVPGHLSVAVDAAAGPARGPLAAPGHSVLAATGGDATLPGV